MKDNLPYRTVDKPGFKNLVKVLNKRYKVPCRQTIKKKIDLKYEFLKNKKMLKVKTLKNICLTTDAWTDSFNTQSFLGECYYNYNNKKYFLLLIYLV